MRSTPLGVPRSPAPCRDAGNLVGATAGMAGAWALLAATTRPGHRLRCPGRGCEGEVCVLDHLIYGVAVLSDGVDELERRLGVRAGPGGRHQGLGTHNALLGLGRGAYLEVIAPDPGQPAPARPRPFGLDALDRPRLVGWAVRCDDLDARVARARAHGHDPGDPVELQRTTADGTVLRWRLTGNALAGGPVPFLIDWGDTIHPSTSAPAGLTLVSFQLEHPRPDALADVLGALGAEVAVVPGPIPALAAGIDGPRGRVDLR